MNVSSGDVVLPEDGASVLFRTQQEDIMGLLDEIKSGLTEKLSSGSNLTNLIDHAMALVNNPGTGGLTGLIETFKNKGLGEIVSSWISTGQNLPVSVDQLKQVLSSEKIQEIATKVGISKDDAARHLSELLPQVIDKLTPDGKLPDANALQEGIGMLKKKFFGI